MPICQTCSVAYLEGESHVCAQRTTSFCSRWRVFAGGGPAGRALKLRPILVAWVIALAITSPLVFLSGELFGLETVLISLVAFPSGLFSVLSRSGLPLGPESPLSRAMVGWILYAWLVVLLVRCTRHRPYRLLFSVLSILLAVNIVGCYTRVLEG